MMAVIVIPLRPRFRPRGNRNNDTAAAWEERQQFLEEAHFVFDMFDYVEQHQSLDRLPKILVQVLGFDADGHAIGYVRQWRGMTELHSPDIASSLSQRADNDTDGASDLEDASVPGAMPLIGGLVQRPE